MKTILQNISAYISGQYYNKNIKKGSKKIIPHNFKNSSERGRFFYQKTGKKAGGKNKVDSWKNNPESNGLKKCAAGSRPQEYPTDNIEIDQYIKRCKKIAAIEPLPVNFF